MKKKIITGITILGIIVGIGGCQSWERSMKSLSSDISGGLDRTVTVYDYNGQVIRQYAGKFDVSESENEVYFDIDGKRVIIHGGIVINEQT